MSSERSLSRYDLLLVAIAMPLVLASLVGALLPVGMIAALSAGTVPATGSIGYALFYDPPKTA